MKIIDIFNERQQEEFGYARTDLSESTHGIPQVHISAFEAWPGLFDKWNGKAVFVKSALTDDFRLFYVRDDVFILSVDENPQIVGGECHFSSSLILGKVKRWVAQNREGLIKYSLGLGSVDVMDECFPLRLEPATTPA